MVWRIEWVPLVMNIGITGFYVWQTLNGEEATGRVLYWAGATLVTTGLLFMRG